MSLVNTWSVPDHCGYGCWHLRKLPIRCEADGHEPSGSLVKVAAVRDALYLAGNHLKIGRYVSMDTSVTYGSMSLKPRALTYSGVSNAEVPTRS